MQLTLTCRNVKTGAKTQVATPVQTQIPQADWPYSACSPTEVAIGGFGKTNAGRVIQFGLGCVLTEPSKRAALLRTSARNIGVLAVMPTATPNLKAQVLAPRGGLAAMLPTATPVPIFKQGVAVAKPGRSMTSLMMVAPKTFEPPLTKSGARLYACQTVGGQPCGQPIADAFCKEQGFARAQSFANGLSRLRGQTLAGQKCTTMLCNVFSKIDCVK